MRADGEAALTGEARASAALTQGRPRPPPARGVARRE
jgi:hypothetical protein